MMRSWTIGSGADCDLVVDRPTVSGRHCRLTRDDEGFVLEDLGSTNGTFLNGARLTGKARVQKGDSITLGQTVPMPWPAEASPLGPIVLRIGREPDNDFVVNIPTVSGYHARVVWEGTPGSAMIEDLGSSNGTALGSPDRKITRSVLSPEDTIYLGSHPIPAAHVLARLDPPARVAPVDAGPQTAGTGPPIPFPRSQPAAWPVELSRAILLILGHPWRLVALLAWAPLAALALVATLGTGPRDLSILGASRNIAALLSWLGLAAIGFGLANALLGIPSGTTHPPDVQSPQGATLLLPRLLVFGALGALQCALAWVIVAQGAGLKGPGLPTLALLVLASAVGLALGLWIDLLVPHLHPASAVIVLALVVLLLGLLDGERIPLPRMPTWTRWAASALPSRWTFEGLLLLESDRSPARVALAPSPAAPARLDDLAEDYFPADSERMGVRADATALGAMLIGLVAACALSTALSRPEP